MSDIKILIDTEVELSKVRSEIEQLQKDLKPIKLSIDSKEMSKVTKEVDQLTNKLGKTSGKKIRLFDESSLKQNQTDFVKIGKSAEDAMRRVEASYKKMNMGDVSLGWDKNAKELDGFTIKVKEAEGLTTSFKYKMGELTDGTSAFVHTGSKGMENLGKTMSDAIKENLKLDNTITQTNQKLEGMSKQYGNLIRPEDRANVEAMMKALDPSDKLYPEKVKEMNIELKRMSDTAKGVLTDQKYMAKQHEEALKINTKMEQDRIKFMNKEHQDALKMNAKFDKELAAARTPKSVDPQRFGGDMQKMGRNMIALSAPVLAVGAASVKAQIDFESAFAGVRKTVSATEEEFQVLSDGIREMSKVMPQSAVEISGVGEIAGQLNIAKESLLDFTKVMVMLGDTTNLSSEQAATSLAQFANIVGMSHSDFDRLGATIVDLGNNSATMEDSIVNMAMRLAGAGAQIGLSEAEILGVSTALSSVGIKAEQGGSSFSRVMTDMGIAATMGSEKVQELEKRTGMTRRQLELMSSNSGKDFKELANSLGMTTTEMNKIIKAGKNLEKFGKIAGMTGEEFKKAFEKDAVGAIGAFVDGLGSAEEKGTSAIELLEEMGVSSVRIRDALLRSGGASKLFNDTVARGNKAWEDNTALTNEAAERYKTAESQLKMLKNTVVDAAIELGGKLAPSVVEVVGQIVELVDKFTQLPESMQVGIIKGALFTTMLGGITSTMGSVIRGSSETLRFFRDLGGLLGGTAKLSKGAGDSINTTSKLIGLLPGTTGLAMAGVVGAVALAVVGISKEIDKTKKKKEELDKAAREIPEVVIGHQKDIDYLVGIQREFETLNRLVGDNGDLSGMTADQQKRYLDLVKEMSGVSPQLETFYNSQGEMVASTRTEIEKLIEAKKEEMRLDKEKAAEGYDKQIQDSKKLTKQLDKNREAAEKELKKKEDRKNAGGEYKTKAGGGRVWVADSDKKKAKLDAEIEELEKRVKGATKGVSANIDKLMEVISSKLSLVGLDFDTVSKHIEGFEGSFKNMLEMDSSPEGIDNADKALNKVTEFAEMMQKVNNNEMRLELGTIQDYVNELTGLGLGYDDVAKSIYGSVVETTKGEKALNDLNQLMKESGNISKPTADAIRSRYGDVKGDINEVNAELISNIGKTDVWAASYLASLMKMEEGVGHFTTVAKTQLDGLGSQDIIKPEQINKQLNVTKKASEDTLAIIEKEKQEHLDIVRIQNEELGTMTNQQRAEEEKRIKEHSEKRVKLLKEELVTQDRAIFEHGKQSRKGLAEVMDDVKNLEKTGKSFSDVWENLGKDTQKLILDSADVKEGQKNWESLVQEWMLNNPEAKTLTVIDDGFDFVLDNIEQLGIDWYNLTSSDKVFVAKALGEGLEEVENFAEEWEGKDDSERMFFLLAKHEGIEDVEKFREEWDGMSEEQKEFTFKAILSGVYEAEQFQKEWEALDPKVQKFIAESVGIEDVDKANRETMASWAEDPRVKMFVAEHQGLDNVRIEKTETDDVWAITIGDKTYKTNEDGAEAAREVIKSLQDVWSKIPNSSTKTFTTERVERVLTTYGRVGVPESARGQGGYQSRASGDKNFKGGLSYVGEKGRELLVYPDGSHELTGNQTELRNLPKGTQIYSNHNTEKILAGDLFPKFDDKHTRQVLKNGSVSSFAKGNVKGNPMPPNATSAQAKASAKKKASASSKEEYKAEYDIYTKINIEIDKQNNLLKKNAALQEKAKDGSFEKIKLIQEQIKLDKQHQALLNNKINIAIRERNQQETLLKKSGFKFKGKGNSKEIANLENIKGKNEKVEEAFNKFNELQFKTIPGLQVEIMEMANAIESALSKGFTQQMRIDNNVKENDHLLTLNRINQEREKDVNKRVVLMKEEIKLIERKAYLSRGQAGLARNERKEIEKTLKAQGFKFEGEGDKRKIVNPGKLKGQVKEIEELFNKYNEIQIDIIPQLNLDGEGFKDQIEDIKQKSKEALIDAMFEKSDREIDDYNYTIERAQNNREGNQRKDPYWQVKTRETELTALEGRYSTEYNKGWDYLNEANKYSKDSEQYDKLIAKSEEYFRASRASELELEELKEDLHRARLQHIDEEIEANGKAQDELRFQLELLAEDNLESRLDLTSKIAEEEIKSYSTLKNTVKTLEEQLAVTLYNTDEWHAINKSLDEYNKKLQDSTLELKKQKDELVKIAQEQARVRFDKDLVSAENSIFGGQYENSGEAEEAARDALDAKIKAHEDYISGEEKSLEIARIRKMVEEDSLVLTREQQQVLEEGGQVERAKLDRLNKQLEIQKLQKKLENLKNQKTIKQLKQNEDGTFDFEYVADKKAIRETEESLIENQRDLANWESGYKVDQEKRIFEEKQKLLDKEEKRLQAQLDAEMKAIEEHYRQVMEKQILMMEMNMALMEQLNSEKSIGGWSKTIEGIMPLMDKLGVNFAELMKELGIDLTDNFDVIFPLLYKMGALNEEMVEGMGIDFKKYLDAAIPVLDEIGVDHEEFLTFMGVDLDAFLAKSGKTFAEYSEAVRKKNEETKKDVERTKEALRVPTESTHTVKLIAPPPFSMPDSSSTHTITTVYRTVGTPANSPKVKSFDTGGHTGSSEGLAYLHQKERVLNRQQTQSFEKLVDLMPSIMKTLDSQSGSILNYSKLASSVPVVNIPSKQNDSKPVGDTINISRVEFPHANDAKEIKEAILGLRERGKQKMR